MNHSLVQADKAFRSRDWRAALLLYQASKRNCSEGEIKRVDLAIRLCETKIEPEATCFDVMRDIEPWDESVESFLRHKTIMSVAGNPSYNGEIINRDLTLNTRNLFSYFSYSPWQASLGFVTALMCRLMVGSKKIADIAEQSYSIGELSHACILHSYLSLIGLSQLELFVDQNKGALNCAKLNHASIAYFHEKGFIEKNEVKAEALEKILRHADRQGIRYILYHRLSGSCFLAKQGSVSETCEVFAGSIFLNERKYLLKCLFNHYPLVDQWCLVEGTCKGYPARKVSTEGLSKDLGWLNYSLFPDPLNKLKYIEHGWTVSSGENAKSELRNRYLSRCTGAVLVVIDIDEFYFADSFKTAVSKILEGYSGVVVPQVHLWKRLNQFIIGGYYDISHMRFFRNYPGMIYRSNHNFPDSADGTRLDKINKFKFDRIIKSRDTYPIWEGTYCFHLGFAKDADDMRDKTEYYVNRGEKDTRPLTTKSRAAWFNDDLPSECVIMSFNQPIPEVIEQ